LTIGVVTLGGCQEWRGPWAGVSVEVRIEFVRLVASVKDMSVLTARSGRARTALLSAASIVLALAISAAERCEAGTADAHCGVSSPTQPSAASIRRPQGIFAAVDIISPTQAQLTPAVQADLGSLYSRLLANRDVDGLSLTVPWSILNPSRGAFDWTALDEAFCAVAATNAANPARKKQIQIAVLPGYTSPAWLTPPAASCDDLLDPTKQSRVTSCSWASFSESRGSSKGQKLALPLPWNRVYRIAWADFLKALAQRYGDNPALAGVAVAGPSTDSTAMLLDSSPNTANWAILIGSEASDPEHFNDSRYQNSYLIFAEAWKQAIDLYGDLFPGVTLMLSPGEFDRAFAKSPQANLDYGALPSLEAFCPAFQRDKACVAKLSVVSYFVERAAAPRSGKALESDGQNGDAFLDASFASDVTRTALYTAEPSQLDGVDVSRVVGGFTEGSASGAPETGACGNVDDVQDLYNKMATLFRGTQGGRLFGSAAGSAALGYIGVCASDIVFADAHNAAANVNVSDGVVKSMRAADVLDLAERAFATGVEAVVVKVRPSEM
jgi:hypothetical protein